ncbi:MAG TPA: hypothetical protein VFQ36_01475, partial [Ktedonobacteraceae bacterium]|nr:hypothetical protein [Ktedonobacteraceae bacterium]
MVAKVSRAYGVDRSAAYFSDEIASPARGKTRARNSHAASNFDLDGDLLDEFDFEEEEEEEEEFVEEEEQRGAI